MEIIKVDAIESTNTFLKEWDRVRGLNESVCVVAKEQLGGKGQMGTVWQSKAGENLTCSVFVPIKNLKLVDQFYISMAVSQAVYDTLNSFGLPKLSIKWPNDILSGRNKVCGILIENLVNNGQLKGIIVGVGININQVEFDNLPLAGSMKQILGRYIEIDEVLDVLLDQLQLWFDKLTQENFDIIKITYEKVLFRKNKPSTFLDAKGDAFVGIIQQVTSIGKLQILLEDEILRDFDLKEIRMLY